MGQINTYVVFFISLNRNIFLDKLESENKVLQRSVKLELL